jgi:hypothetical protein
VNDGRTEQYSQKSQNEAYCCVNINPLKRRGNYMYRLLSVSNCAFCICGSCMILTVNSDNVFAVVNFVFFAVRTVCVCVST